MVQPKPFSAKKWSGQGRTGRTADDGLVEWTLDTSKLLTKDCLDMVPAAYHGRKAKILNIKEIKTSSINHHYRLTHSVTVDLVEERFLLRPS